jgi:hypothetical protein
MVDVEIKFIDPSLNQLLFSLFEKIRFLAVTQLQRYFLIAFFRPLPISDSSPHLIVCDRCPLLKFFNLVRLNEEVFLIFHITDNETEECQLIVIR